MSKFSYKGYKAAIDWSAEDETFVGKVLDIEPLILFSGDAVDDLVSEFRSAVDEYLEHCRRAQHEPAKACSGTFNVRVGADVHRRAIYKARDLNISLNEFVKKSIEKNLSSEDKKPRDIPMSLETLPVLVSSGMQAPWETRPGERPYGPDDVPPITWNH